MQFGKLKFIDVLKRPGLTPKVVSTPIKDNKNKLTDILVAEIDPTLADTAAFCEAYDIPMNTSANCVIVEAKRADKTWYAACVILATNRADINGIVRRHLDARKVSFAQMDLAVNMTGMEYGGITPIGLPSEFPIIVDVQVASSDKVIIGSGLRKSKLLVSGSLLSSLSNSTVLHISKD